MQVKIAVPNAQKVDKQKVKDVVFAENPEIKVAPLQSVCLLIPSEPLCADMFGLLLQCVNGGMR